MHMPSSNKFQKAEKHGAPDYGLLGNLIAGAAKRFFADVDKASHATVAKQGIHGAKMDAASMIVPVSAPVLVQTKVARPSPFEGIKAFVRMLWSNFLPDQTLDRAIEALKARDKTFSMDAPEGHGGYITAEQKKRMLPQVQEEM